MCGSSGLTQAGERTFSASIVAKRWVGAVKAGTHAARSTYGRAWTATTHPAQTGQYEETGRETLAAAHAAPPRTPRVVGAAA